MTDNDSHSGITIGARVRITHRPELDAQVLGEVPHARALLDGKIGKVLRISGAAPGGFAVHVEGVGSAWFLPQELAPLVTDPDGFEVAPLVPAKEPQASEHGDAIRRAAEGLELRLSHALAAVEANAFAAKEARQAAQEAQGERDALRTACEQASGVVVRGGTVAQVAATVLAAAEAWENEAKLARADADAAKADLSALRGKLGAANAEVEEAAAMLLREREVRQAAEEKLVGLALVQADLDALRAAVEAATGSPEGATVADLVTNLALLAKRAENERAGWERAEVRTAELSREVEARQAADREAIRLAGLLHTTEARADELATRLSRVAGAFDVVRSLLDPRSIPPGDPMREAVEAVDRALAGVAPVASEAKPSKIAGPWTRTELGVWYRAFAGADVARVYGPETTHLTRAEERLRAFGPDRGTVQGVIAAVRRLEERLAKLESGARAATAHVDAKRAALHAGDPQAAQHP